MVEEYEKQEAANEADGVANGLDQSDLVSTLIICKFSKITIDIKNLRLIKKLSGASFYECYH